jgi:cobalt-precorrin-7 (C5)-methyltransferase
MNEIYIIGVGPGDPDFITIHGKNILNNADCVAGFNSAINVVEKYIRGQKIIINYKNETEMLKFISEEARKGIKCVIVCYGDPNFSDIQFIQKIKSFYNNIKIIPGISSIQIALSKSGIPFEESIFITFHKSGTLEFEKEELLKYVREGNRNVILLPRPWDFMPKEIAEYLILNGISENIEVIIYENLTLKDEKTYNIYLGDLRIMDKRFSDLTILIIKRRN